MAIHYVDPTGTGDGTDPQNGSALFSTLTVNAGDTVLFRGGKTSYETVLPIAGASEASPTVYGSYGGGKHTIDGQDSINTMYSDNKDNIIVKDIIVINSSGGGIALRSGVSIAPDNCKILRCEAHDCAGTGLNIGFVASNVDYIGASNMLIQDCKTSGNGSHGQALFSSTGSSRIIRPVSTGDCLLTNAWGVYVGTDSTKFTTDAWTLSGGTTYYRDLPTTGKTVIDVIASGNSGEPWYLTENAGLSDGQWNQIANVIHVNIGEEIATKSIVVLYGDTTNVQVVEPDVSKTGAGGDGVGVGLDHGVKSSHILGGKSNDNIYGHGCALNIPQGCSVRGIEVKRNGKYGIHIATARHTINVYDLISENNTLGDAGITRLETGNKVSISSRSAITVTESDINGTVGVAQL